MKLLRTTVGLGVLAATLALTSAPARADQGLRAQRRGLRDLPGQAGRCQDLDLLLAHRTRGPLHPRDQEVPAARWTSR